ncbi:MAG: ASKHA domain-containing protein [Peptostreptococcaceae bacterium]
MTEKFKIKFIPQNIELEIDKRTTILEAQIVAGLMPDAPCGGKGTCGKCLVKLVNENKMVKACTTYIEDGLIVEVSNNISYSILTSGSKRNVKVEPIIKSINVKIDKCKVGENKSDWKRLKEAISNVSEIKEDSILPNVSLTTKLYDLLKENNYELNVLLKENEVIDLRKEDKPWYILAFDIGTTTIVAYLLDSKTGEELAVASTLNPQSQFGADVIMRANYSIENGIGKLSNSVREALNELINSVTNESNIEKEDIYLASIVGNTCMHHLFLGISPKSLVYSPYNPSISERLILDAKEYDININSRAKLILLPNIAGFVGADTVGVLLATEVYNSEELTLAIDIGTNGELVMGNKEKLITCSTAAGPAFEGAKIMCGMRGAEGAIDHVEFIDGKLKYTTIGNTKPIGICGSGLIDLVAELLKNGYIKKSGRFRAKDEIKNYKEELERIIEIDGMKCYVLAFENESDSNKKIFLSQKDIREVQLAKAAIAAGINLMAEELDININNIEKVLIAGAFGNYMSPQSACDIGLIPKELKNKIIPIGNAAGEGAKIAALNGEEFKNTQKTVCKVAFLELATNSNFQDCFIDELEFPVS